MTYRTNPHTGDRVSLLGYGLHALADPPRSDGKGDEVDQETVNELVDYANGHGVNYFDTSPVYVQGLSERSTGIALSRHPATNISWRRSSRIFRITRVKIRWAMYRRSLEELQTDYFDYYLLHSVGGGTGIPAGAGPLFRQRHDGFPAPRTRSGART